MLFCFKENGFLHRRNTAGRRFYSFRTVAPQHTDDVNRLILPEDYLTAIYDPPDATAKIFIVHPSHRYAGVFQAVASGMTDQVHQLLYESANPFYELRLNVTLLEDCLKYALFFQV